MHDLCPARNSKIVDKGPFLGRFSQTFFQPRVSNFFQGSILISRATVMWCNVLWLARHSLARQRSLLVYTFFLQIRRRLLLQYAVCSMHS